MRTNRIALLVLIALGVLSLVQNGWYWRQLPARVATHFGIDGEPNAWMDKPNATLLMCAVQIGLPWFLVGVAALTRYLPASMINIPHREYWLHPDRRDATLCYVNSKVMWIAVVATLFMMTICHLTFLANRSGESLQSSWFVFSLLLYLATMFTLVIQILVHFRLPRSAS